MGPCAGRRPWRSGVAAAAALRVAERSRLPQPPHLCKRNVNESDSEMQKRVQELVDTLRAVRPPSTASAWCVASPEARLTERVRAGDRR